MSASKDKGTRAETAVVHFLRVMGHKHAERRTLRGAKDAGDIAGIPGIVIEVKDCQRMELATWLDEVDKEQDEALAHVGVIWHKRRGRSNPGEWYVTMTGWSFINMIEPWTELKS